MFSPSRSIMGSALALFSTSAAFAANMLPSNGDVGIGTTNPAYKTHLYGDDAVLAIDAIGNKDPVIIFSQDSDFSNSWTVRSDVSNSRDFEIRYGNARALSIGTNGFVGLGTHSPRQKLDVRGNIEADHLYLTDVQDVGPTNKKGTLIIGDPEGANIGLDDNERG